MTVIQIRRGTTSEWTTGNPILAAGEMGYDITLKDTKMGTGSTTWTNLPFLGAAKVSNGEQDVYVEDYLAANRVPGTTDDLAAFNAAIATGKRVRARETTFHVSKSPSWGDNTWFKGSGKGRTIIKLLTSAPGDASLWCNKDLTGNTQGYWADFTLDGFASRPNGATGGNGTRSSGLSLRNAHYWYIDRVSVINPVQHAFDVTNGSLDYPYGGDGVLAGTRSDYIWFDQCDGSGFGDDAFTCHSSDYITYSRCIGFNPRKKENCNAFEIDGDSRYVTLNDNRSYNCYGGIEIKGHDNESAAQGVTINGHISTRDVRSYHFRHIGHHLGPNTDTGAPGDPPTKSAFDIVATNLVSIFPGNRTGFQEDTTPSALNISAFSNVSITNFTAIGDPAYDFAGESVVTLKYLAHNIKLTNFNFRNFKNSAADIYVSGGFNMADRIIIDGVNSLNSSPRVVTIGTGNPFVSVNNINAIAPSVGALYGVDAGYSSDSNFTLGDTINLVGYPTAVRFKSTNYATSDLFRRRMQNAPTGFTRLIDLDPTKDYYFSTSEWATLTDIPSGQSGANFVEHSKIYVNSVMQKVVRNTTGTTQTAAWRVIDVGTKTAGPWNIQSVNDMVPISGILPFGGSPPGGSAAGTVWLVRSS